MNQKVIGNVLIKTGKGMFLNFKENRKAIFSRDMRYRYTLEIRWGSGDLCQFIGLNPSTADEMKDDRTVRKCKGWAMDWGFDGMVMTNLFAFRSTYPKVMKAERNPIGEYVDIPDLKMDGFPKMACFSNMNDLFLASTKLECKRTIAAWGNDGVHQSRSELVRFWIGPLQCFKKTKTGEPWHPLYLPNAIKLEEL